MEFPVLDEEIDAKKFNNFPDSSLQQLAELRFKLEHLVPGRFSNHGRIPAPAEEFRSDCLTEKPKASVPQGRRRGYNALVVRRNISTALSC